MQTFVLTGESTPRAKGVVSRYAGADVDSVAINQSNAAMITLSHARGEGLEIREIGTAGSHRPVVE